MKTRFKSIATFVTAFACLGVSAGCNMSNPDEPEHVYVGEVDEPTVMELMEVADLEYEADFVMFEAIPAPETKQVNFEATGADHGSGFTIGTCPLGTPDPVESPCGYCTCSAGGGIVCVDYQCDPSGDYLMGKPADAGDDPGNQWTGDNPEYANGWCTPGESWMEDCNVCTCQGDGTPACTKQACTDPIPF